MKNSAMCKSLPRGTNEWNNLFVSGLAEWNDPTGGMFLWVKLLHIADTKKLITEKALKKEVVWLWFNKCLLSQLIISLGYKVVVLRFIYRSNFC